VSRDYPGSIVGVDLVHGMLKETKANKIEK
jgi:hypothetical protein